MGNVFDMDNVLRLTKSAHLTSAYQLNWVWRPIMNTSYLTFLLDKFMVSWIYQKLSFDRFREKSDIVLGI